MAKAKRNYRKEYDNYQGKPGQIKDRSLRNKARKILEDQGRVTKGDGKDVHHVSGNTKNNSPGNLRAVSKSSNRSFARTKSGKAKRAKG